MGGDTEKVELNDRTFVLSHDLAAALVAEGLIDQCRACDPAETIYHLDPDHTVEDLRRAGAQEWSPSQRPDKTGGARLPILLAHHESGGASGH